jgi:rhodanese-related sulfurtransferase
LALGLPSVLLLAGQKHALVDASAAETEAPRLHQELAQGKKLLVIDVRSPKEYAEGHVPGAKNVPIEELAKKIGEMGVPKDSLIVTMCDRGGRSSRAVRELQKLGYQASSFCRLDSWKEKGYKIERGDRKPPKTSSLHKFTSQHYCQSEKGTNDLDQVTECAFIRPYRECWPTG